MATPAIADRTAPGTVLLVEDNPDDVFLVKRAFQEGGIPNPLVVLNDGRDALKYLTGDDQNLGAERAPLPILVLLDLNIPILSGFEVLSQIRHHPRLIHLPVVVFTGSSLSPDVSRAYRLGANSFLTKPAELEVLKVALKEVIQFWGTKGAAHVSAAGPPGPPPSLNP